MKNILMIVPTPFFADRGCHVRILEEARILQELGNQVTICTYHNGRNISGVSIKRIINIPWYKKLSPGPSYHKIYLDMLLFFKVFSVFRKIKPDVIHAHLHEGVFLGYVFKKIFKIPLVADLQGSLTGELYDHNFIEKRTLKYKFWRWLENKIVNMPDKIIFSSSSYKGLLPQEFDTVQDKIVAISDGVDSNQFHPDYEISELKRQLDLENKNNIVVFLGVLTKYQGVNDLLGAIAYIVKTYKDIHFLIMGFPDVERYRNMARDMGILPYITFTGKIKYQDVPRYLCLGDIAVSPKLSKTEANGKLYNYMACGLPIVVYESPINREILGDLGIYAEYGDVVSLADNIKKLLSNKQLMNDISSKMKEEVANNHSWRQIGEKILGVYEKANAYM